MILTDQLNRSVHIEKYPQRIVSTVPSQTELLADLDLEREVIGITKFCTSPERWLQSKKRIGGTKTLNLEAIASLHPDLILANKEENSRQDLEWLMERFPVWVSDVRTLSDALNMIVSVGELTNRHTPAESLSHAIQKKLERITRPSTLIPTAYLIWCNPYMTINADTFIHHTLELSGFTNVFGARQDSRYPVVTVEELIAASPEIVLLSSEPFPFGEKHIHDLVKHLPNSKIMLADGAMFSWYGSRLLHFDPSPYRL
jgi:ABC-type Fe3+-hydroxamate transport system substrate-binding protein